MHGAPSGEQAEKDERTLTSWKEIASLLGVSVRTAQSYEKNQALPVRRSGARVVALERELRDWQASRQGPPPWWRQARLLLWWAGGATAILLAFVLTAAWYYWFHLATGPPVAAVWQGSRLIGVDSRGRSVWQRQHTLARWGGEEGYRTVDVDNDGKNETVYCYRHSERDSRGWNVSCLSSTGKDLWGLAPTRIVRNATRTFMPPYVTRDFTVFPSPDNDGTYWTAAVFAHHVEYPSVLLVADGKGRPRGEFWHAGHLNKLKAIDWNGDGKVELVAGGVLHGAEQAVLQVLDPRNVHGAAHIDVPDAPRQFPDMTPGTEKATLFFPRTGLNRKVDKFNFVGDLVLVGETLQVTVIEHLAPELEYLIWTLTPQFEVKSLSASVSYEVAVAEAHLKGEIQALQDPNELERLKSQVRIVRRAP